MILLKNLVTEKADFNRLKDIESGLSKKYGSEAFGMGTFGVELEFSIDLDQHGLDIDTVSEAYSDQIISYFVRNEPGDFLYDYRSWLEENRSDAERDFAKYSYRQGADAWDDSYGPIDPELFSRELEPKRDDFDTDEEYQTALENFEYDLNEVEKEYRRWDSDELTERFAEEIVKSGKIENYISFHSLAHELDLLHRHESEAIDSINDFFEEIGERISSDEPRDGWRLDFEHDNMFEIVSPILTMKDFDKLEKIILFVYNNFIVHKNSSAHVHVGVPGNFDYFDAIAVSTLIDENEIKKFDPDRNFTKWAKLSDDLHSVIKRRIENKTKRHYVILSASELNQYVPGDRYFGTNLQSMRTHGTIEFRYFSSQIAKNPHKFFEYIKYFLMVPVIAKNRKSVYIGNQKGKRVLLIRLPDAKVGIVFEENYIKLKQNPNAKPVDMKKKGIEFKDRYRYVDKLSPLEKRAAKERMWQMAKEKDFPFKQMVSEQYPSTFSMDEFNSIKGYRGKVKYASERLKRLGAGSSRIVYKIDDTKALKLAKNRKGLAQNSVETDGYFRNMDIAANVFDYDSNHDEPYWVEMELAKPLARNQKLLEKLLGFSIDELEAFLHISNPQPRRVRFDFTGVISDERIQELWEDEYAVQLIDLVGNISLEIGDIVRPSSWGVVSRNGKMEPVLIDFGFTNHVRAHYYAR